MKAVPAAAASALRQSCLLVRTPLPRARPTPAGTRPR